MLSTDTQPTTPPKHISLIAGDKDFRPDERIQEQLLKLLLFISIPTLLSFSLFHWALGFNTLAMIQATLLAFLLPSLFFYYIRPTIPVRIIKVNILCVAIVALHSLLIEGGFANTGIYWVSIFPFVAFSIMGLHHGWRWVLVFIAIGIGIAVMHKFEMIHISYSLDELTLFSTTFIFYTFVAAVFEGFRERHQYEINHTNEHLRQARRDILHINQGLERQIVERTTELRFEIKEHQKTNASLKEKEELFQQAQKMEAVGTLVGGIAHDFNNMLSGINANLFMIKRRCQDNPDVTGRLVDIESLVFHASEMIKQLLTFARKDHVEFKTFNATPFFGEAYKLAELSIPENIKLQCNFTNQKLYINGNATQLQQIMMNLINNARDALKETASPHIHIELKEVINNSAFKQAHPDLDGEAYLCLSITDNGSGIPAEKINHIFEPFFTTKTVGEGTGLGLAMCYGAIQSHKGTIVVKSKIAKGSNFSIYLPLQSKAELDSTQSKGLMHQSSQGETLLLVDDHDTLRKGHREALESLGYTVIEASDGLKAVEAFKNHYESIDLIIMDVMMPNMGGVQASKHIQKISPNIPIIFATGYDKDSTLDRDHPLNETQQILTKPFTIEAMSTLIQERLQNKK